MGSPFICCWYLLFIFSTSDAPFLNRLAVITIFQIILITIIVMEIMRLHLLDRQLKRKNGCLL